ncbi:MAG: exodeoxyribonuclease VII large subunit [Synechococcales bacterium]|nr:exodeoxyribonuclease VII large subunit [Synechococcales bacterium]
MMTGIEALPPQTLTIAGLTDYLKDCLELDPHLQQIWVLGEVSSVSRSSKGLHFTLQDETSKQSLTCVAWNSYAQKLKISPSAGDQVIALGSVRLYPQQSRYQLQVYQLLAAGEGLQALRFRQLHDRLAAEGLFDRDRKRALPTHPQTIAVVTSPHAAAWGDIQKTLRDRYPGLQVLLSPAIVQGREAPASIEAAIDRIETDGRAEVVILARGGGASEDLTCFNDERVVRAVATCGIPVVTGIGHERDESLADLAADYAAHTPTAAAEVTVPRLSDLWDHHHTSMDRLREAIQAAIAQQAFRLDRLQARLQRANPQTVLNQQQQALKQLKRSLIQATRLSLTQAQHRQALCQQQLMSLDPNLVLKRGYAVVRAEGQILRSPQDLQLGQAIEITLAQGAIQAQITALPTPANPP